MSVSSRSRASGFTLLEGIIALMILMFITLSAWYTFDGIARMKDVVESTEEVTNSSRVAMQRMSRELRMVFLTRHPSPSGMYLTAFWGDDQGDQDRVIFNAFSHIRLYQGSTEADTTEITYSLEADPDNPGLNLLMHREASRIDGKPDEGGVIEVLARNVKAFNVRYYDHLKEEWRDTWDSAGIELPGRMPRAIEVSLVLVDRDGGEHPYGTTLMIPMYRTPPAGGQQPERTR